MLFQYFDIASYQNNYSSLLFIYFLFLFFNESFKLIIFDVVMYMIICGKVYFNNTFLILSFKKSTDIRILN